MRDHLEKLFPGLLQMHEAKSRAWKNKDSRLFNTQTEQYLYPDAKCSDQEFENAIVDQWFTQATCMQTVDGPSLQATLKVSGSRFRESPFATITDLSISAIHDSGIDYHGDWACAQLYSFLNEEVEEELGEISDHSGGLLLIFGIANARAMSAVIGACRPRIVLIIEEQAELCCAKLEEEGCKILLNQLSHSSTSLFLITDSEPDKAFNNAKGLIEVTNVLCQEKIFSATFRDSDLNNAIKERFITGKRMMNDLGMLGFFVDELHMSMNAGLSFSHLPPRIINYDSVAPHQHHAVVAASGPSLKESISYLQKYRKRFHLFSCYSTLRALLLENIEPDFHCNQERHACHIPMLENQRFKAYASGSILLCSANNDPRMNQMYKDCVAFFRSASSASALFARSMKNVISGEGTQVANLALVFAVLLGYRTIHLVGVDLGTANANQTRIENAFSYDGRKYTIPAPGNRQETILTNDKLIEVADYMSMLIDGAILPGGTPIDGLKVYNYSNGLRIPGTISAVPEQLDLHLEDRGSEESFIQSSLQAIHRPNLIWGQTRFLGYDWQHKISGYTAYLREITTHPFDRDRLEDHLQSSQRPLGSLEEQVMSRLMAGSLTRAWYLILMVHERLGPDDQKNQAWEMKAVNILHTLIESMEKLLLEMVDYVENLESIDQHLLVSTLF